MTPKLDCPETATKTSYFRLISATEAQWEQAGPASMSARQIAVAADAPVSSIYHHFDSLEHLFLTSQQECVTLAQDWCERQLAAVSGIDGAADGFAGFFACIVDEWTQHCRPLAFAWRECLLLADRNPAFAPPAAQWRRLWAEFWQQAGTLFALGPGTIIAERLFDNESLLHMIRWRRPIDRAALDETARGLAAWLAGTPPPAAPWREYAHAEVTRSMPRIADHDAVTSRIMAAAADLIESAGAANVTHRAVAERAGVTLGTVSHKFRTKSALLEVALEGIYDRMTRRFAEGQPPSPPPRSQRGLGDILEANMRGPRMLVSDEVFVAAARDPALGSFGAQLRYLRGRTSRATLQAVLGSRRTAGILDGALFSGFVSSQLRAYAPLPQEERAAGVQSELDVLEALLCR